MFNLVGALLYVVVAVFCALAARKAGPNRWQWFGIAMALIILALWRGFQGEAWLHDAMRELAAERGSYDQRAALQAPLVITGVVLSCAAGWLLLRASAPRPLWLARGSVFVLLAYSALRAISFHPVDMLIYAGIGPFHLNHGIDIGLTFMILAGAVLQLRGKHRGLR